MLRTGMSVVLIAVLTCVLMCPCATADEHVVKPSELRAAIVEAARTRQDNLDRVHRFFSSEPAAKVLKNAHLDPVKIERAVSQLDDQELAGLASRTGQIQGDLAAGALTTQQLTYIVIALATAVIVLIIVER